MDIRTLFLAKTMGGGNSGGNVQPLEITENGTYTAEGDVTGYSPVTVNVSPSADVTAIEDALVSGTISGSYTNDRVTTLKTYAFNMCKGLTEVNFPSVIRISANAFQGCTNLTKAIFPVATEVGSLSFGACAMLTEVSIPLVTTIESQGFQICKALVKLDLPSVTSIENMAFTSSNLTTLILRSEILCTSGSSILGSTPIGSGKGYIYVPSALIGSYKANSSWKTYAAQFRALENYTVDGTITGELDETKI